MSQFELGCIGGGNMAEAIVRGVLASGVLTADQVVVSDPAAGRRELFAALNIRATADNRAAADAARVLLAVKPQTIDAVLAELGEAIAPDALVISIAAGVSTARIEAGLGGRGHRVVRVMPNTPMLVGQGMSALCKGAHATDADLLDARRLFDAAGKTVLLPDESLIDPVTAVSGSGPAYFFYLIEWMIAGAVDEGLNPEDALALAVQTCAGSARLLAESGDSPHELRRKVTSPGGTTQAACELLDSRGADNAIRAAVRAAAARSRELGRA